MKAIPSTLANSSTTKNYNIPPKVSSSRVKSCKAEKIKI